MSLPRYSEYKNSEVEWLGQVPSKWEVKRVKHTTYLKGRVGWKGLTSDEYLETGYAYLVTGTDFSKKFINWNDCHCVEQARYDDDPFIQLRDGDLLITKDGTIGKLALVARLDRPACLNSGIFLIRPTSCYVTDYMYWVLQSDAFKGFCDLSSLGSTIQHLYQNVFENFAFPVPSLEEQTAIATFLDRETGKIDALIAEQEKLLVLLAEKRQATISHAVTKGLNPDAPMKDSGCVWLGDVPSDWTITRMKHVIREGIAGPYGSSLTKSTYVASGYRVYGQQQVIPNDFSVGDYYISEEKLSEMTRYLVRPNDVLMSVMGTIGRAALVPDDVEPGIINPRLVLYRVIEEIIAPRYLQVFINNPTSQRYFSLAAQGTTMEGLNMVSIGELQIPLPSLEEQHKILEFISHETACLDALTAEATRAIDLLKERRTALISAAVTGKIDVRKFTEC